MAKKNKVKKQRKSKQNFAQKLAQKLRELGIGEVTEDTFDDDSGLWISFRIKDTELCFSFDIKGENIDRVGMYKDKVEVTDSVLVWGN